MANTAEGAGGTGLLKLVVLGLAGCALWYLLVRELVQIFIRQAFIETRLYCLEFLPEGWDPGLAGPYEGSGDELVFPLGVECRFWEAGTAETIIVTEYFILATLFALLPAAILALRVIRRLYRRRPAGQGHRGGSALTGH
ncbi:hypothetical protein I6N91_05050 [Arthrobacter sp. MSA 4-2]|uniref:hypothetical protein n=1 Tax=Arthrobacter sp. MSA 4-2 TaxID=2794349 RepID=UPI0018E76A37|nr:hypothetical protein [Arthrobacter sp. MSA 4-2]MBJ2120345.1 hypothetical protein [Arthrobacter sp. MSA 4-2]